MTDPVFVLLVHFAAGLAYGAWCIGGLIRDGVPIRGWAIVHNLMLIVGAWELVVVVILAGKVRRMVRRNRIGQGAAR